MVERRLLVAAIFIVCLAFARAPVLAQSPMPSIGAQELDVLIVIDQSQSMGGGRNEPASDAESHRISLVEQILRRLSADIFESSRRHRASIIEFGSADKTRVAVDWVELAHDPADPAKPFTTVDFAMARVAPQNLHYTDTPKALALVKSQMDRLKPVPGASARSRIVLLITDGRPERQNNAPAKVLRQEIETQVRALRDAGAVLWVIGLDRNNRFWDQQLADGGPSDGTFWRTVTGDADRALRAVGAFPDAVKLANVFVDRWLRERTPAPSGWSFVATPYLRQLVVSVQYPRPQPAVTLVDPSGRTVAPVAGAGSAGGATSGLFNLFVLKDPPTGEYRLMSVDATEALIEVREYGPVATLVGPGGELPREVPSTLAFQLNGANPRIAMDAVPGWPISGTVQITGVGGRQVAEVPVRMAEKGRVLADWTPDTAGQYVARLRLKATGPDGSVLDLFRGADINEFPLTVSRHAPFNLMLEAPAVGVVGLFPGLGEDGVDLRFRLVEGSGRFIERLDEVVANPATWLKAEAIDPVSGQPVGGPLKVALDGDRFVVSLPAGFDLWRGEGWLVPLERALRVKPMDALLDGRRLSGVRLDGGAVPERVAGDPMTLAGFLLRWPLWVTAGLATVVAALAAALVAGVAWWQIPRHRIRSEDRRRGAVVELIVYDRRRGYRSGKQIPVTGIYRQTFKHVLEVQDGGTRRKIAALSLRRMDVAGGRTAAEVTYRYDGDPKPYSHIIKANPDGEKLRGLKDHDWFIALRETTARSAA
ncbi:hypothetical protein A6A40_29775 (plasmid) [Azospirillum humicireducens]|uniref:VWFA domain-containing protein n=1 Tax=Azospirillum humicireducens TaxID=1226968 RepID=A0A2R4VXG0_9PROT|nr:vWA domain-containing protein [Azospirillum humicireducens]AWB09150.1 hypothetical protein A6A40_29775 [Azospirillum humicireducens]